MPQFHRKRWRTEIRARLKGTIFILTVVEQKQTSKAKPGKNNNNNKKELKVCIQISSVESFSKLPVVMPSLTPTWHKTQAVFPSLQFNLIQPHTDTEHKPNRDGANISPGLLCPDFWPAERHPPFLLQSRYHFKIT